MGNRVTVCHWDNGGHWQAIEVSTSALSGHTNHDLDIWPPIDGVSPGHNWPQGTDVWLNGCVLAPTPTPTATSSTTASPSPTPTPTSTLPDTGAEAVIYTITGIVLIVTGGWLKHTSRKDQTR